MTTLSLNFHLSAARTSRPTDDIGDSGDTLGISYSEEAVKRVT